MVEVITKISHCSTTIFNTSKQLVRVQSAHLPGYNAALSSSLRDGPIRGQAAMFASKAFEGKKVLLLQVRVIYVRLAPSANIIRSREQKT
jgi:hypothetical protein